MQEQRRGGPRFLLLYMEETRRVTYSSIETNLTRSFLVLKEHLKTVGVVQLTQSNVLCLVVL